MTVTFNYPKRPKPTAEQLTAAFYEVADNINVDAHHLAAAYIPGMDGYELGKTLERVYREVITAEKVGELDELDFYYSDLRRQLDGDWVRANNVRPPLPAGADIGKGIIAGVYDHHPAYYYVKEHGDEHSSRHLLFKFEDAVSMYNGHLQRLGNPSNE